MPKSIGAILPHLGQFGGVRRFLELGNVFVPRGYSYTIFASNPEPPDWFDYAGELSDWTRISADVILIGDPPSFSILKHAIGAVYVWVLAGGEYLAGYKAIEGRYPMLLNSRLFLADFPQARLCQGGIDTSHFRPGLMRVGYYAGRGSVKGEDLILGDLADLEHVRLVRIEKTANSNLPNLYRSLDYFVCAERRAGWPNTAVEALACGVPVVSISQNTAPFQNRVIQVDSLREFFESPMREFSWERVADRLEEIWSEDGLP